MQQTMKRIWLYFTAFKNVRHYQSHLKNEHIETLRQAIVKAEQGHQGEIRLVIEHQLPLSLILKKSTARQRALQWFSDLHMWDTENNTGILLYLLLNEKKIEIIADRGIAAQVSQEQWNHICLELQNQISAKQILTGLTTSIHQFGQLLSQHFPHVANENNPDELSNTPIIII